MIVGILAAQVTHGRLGLHAHVVLNILDIEHRLRRVLHPPHDDRRNLDRVTELVVDLQAIAVEVARAQRDLHARIFLVGGRHRRFTLADRGE